MDNRTHFIVAAGQFVNVDEVFFTWESIKVLVHMQAAGDAESPDIYQWNEDGVIVELSFSIDSTKSVSLLDLSLALVATDGTNTFELDRLNVNLVPNVSTTPVLNVDDTRGYVLPTGSEFNLLQITTGAVVGDKQFYTGVIGQKITWQEWIANANVPSEFIDLAQENDGLNQKASNFSGLNGYDIHLKGIATTQGSDSVQGVQERTYEILSTAVTIYDYNESDDGEIVSGTITTLDSTGTYDLGLAFLEGESTLFRTTWVGLSALNLADLGYVIHRIEPLNAPGNLQIEESSSFRGAVTGGKLGVMSTYQSGADIISECLITAGLDASQWKLSARIQIPAYPLFVEVTSTFPGGYVLIENLTAATSQSGVNGSALLFGNAGDSFRVTLSSDPTQDAGNAALLWAGVGSPSTPQDGGTWSDTAQEYPHGIAVGDQIVTEKQITFTLTQVNTIDADFFNRFTWSVVKHIKFAAGSAVADLTQLDDGKGYTYDSTLQSGVVDTNAPQNTYSSAVDLTGKAPAILDHIQTTPNKANQLIVNSFGGLNFAESINATTNGLVQTQITNTGADLYDRLVADGYGVFGVVAASGGASGGSVDNASLRYAFCIFKPTNLNFSSASPRPIVDAGTFNYAATSSSLYYGIYRTNLTAFDENAAGIPVDTKPYQDEAYLNLVYSTGRSSSPYAVATTYSSHFENSTDGIIIQDTANGGVAYTGLSTDRCQDRSVIGNELRFEPIASTGASSSCGIFELLSFVVLTEDQIEDLKARFKTFYSI